MAPDWKADGKQEAEGVLIRRLDFPVRSVTLHQPDSHNPGPYIEIVLGHPLTQDRNLDPLRPGQRIEAWRTVAHERGFWYIRGVLDEVLEGVVRLGAGPATVIWKDCQWTLDPEPENLLIRPDQYIAGSG